MIYQVLVHAAGVLFLLGLCSVAYTLFSKKLTVVRKPLYYLALPMCLVLFATYMNFLVEQVWQRPLLPGTATRIALIAAFFILGLLLNLVPYADRREFEQIVRNIEQTNGTNEKS
jgi:membrane protein YdbS with pleckstrin-like domain